MDTKVSKSVVLVTETLFEQAMEEAEESLIDQLENWPEDRPLTVDYITIPVRLTDLVSGEDPEDSLSQDPDPKT